MSLLDEVRPETMIVPTVADVAAETYDPYHLTPEQLEAREQELFDAIRAVHGDAKGVYAAWIQPANPLADIVKTYEAAGDFAEIEEIVADYEDLCLFLVIADTRGDEDKVVHAFRFSGRDETIVGDKDVDIKGEPVTLTGMPFIDDIVRSGQGLNGDEFERFYEENGISLARSISVETNFRIAETEPYNGLRISDVGYIALFNHVDRMMDGGAEGLEEGGNVIVFAHLNTPAIKSLGAIGVEHQDIAGVPGLQTPTVGEKQFDDKYAPVGIPGNENNLAVFRALSGLAAPEVHI